MSTEKLTIDQQQILHTALDRELSLARDELERQVLGFHTWRAENESRNYREKGQPIELFFDRWITDLQAQRSKIEKLLVMVNNAKRAKYVQVADA